MSFLNRNNNARGFGNTSNPGNKEVCKFYLEGRCRYGDACRNYHPPRDQSSQSRSQQLPYHLNADSIKADLTTGDDRPSWPLSAFGPGRDAPRQLLEGTIELSPEELRVQYYLGKASGNTQEYEQNERNAIAQANQQADRILNDMDGAIKYVIDGKDQHPNREDIAQKGPPTFRWTEKPSFNQAAASSTTGSAFGQPSTFGSAPAFGQPSGTGPQQTSTFGQPSAFGSTSAFGGKAQTGGSAFGQASNLGPQTSAFGARTSAFGAPSALGSGGSAFGKPSPLGGGGSTFGQTSALGGNTPFGGGAQTGSNNQGSTFGQPSPAGGGSTFGRPSPFGAAAASGTSAFGQAQPFGGGNVASSATPAFGQPSAPGQQQSTFGQSTGTGQQSSTFGQPSSTGQQSSTFGQPSSAGQQQSTFGQSSFGQSGATGSQQPAFGRSTFGQSSSMGGQQQSTFGQSSFGQPSNPGQQQSAFGSGTFGAGNPPQTAGFSTFGSQTNTTATTTTRAPGQPLTNWKGRPVTTEDKNYFYYDFAGKKHRIWHPDGAPDPNPNKVANKERDFEADDPTFYDDGVVGRALKEIYDYVNANGAFKDGLVPEIPPKREWVSWDI